ARPAPWGDVAAAAGAPGGRRPGRPLGRARPRCRLGRPGPGLGAAVAGRPAREPCCPSRREARPPQERQHPMTDRELNWAGYSIQTIAAMYESDAAAREAGHNPSPSANAYWVSAWRAEEHERQLDKTA